MNEKKIIREALQYLGWTQETLAKKVGIKNQAGVAKRLLGKSMRVDTFYRLLNGMGFTIKVKSSDGKMEWEVNSEEK